MTRINSAINPKNLTDEHLLAEHREIKRICNAFYKRNLINDFSGIKNKFSLGTGHVLFFINKPVFTKRRYVSIYNECLKRNFNIENYLNNWNVYDNTEFQNIDYKTTYKEQLLLSIRIEERINDSKKFFFHYYGEKISKEKSIEILLKDNYYK
jgi:deoxyribonuclease (pyrimidine dimer)